MRANSCRVTRWCTNPICSGLYIIIIKTIPNDDIVCDWHRLCASTGDPARVLGDAATASCRDEVLQIFGKKLPLLAYLSGPGQLRRGRRFAFRTLCHRVNRQPSGSSDNMTLLLPFRIAGMNGNLPIKTHTKAAFLVQGFIPSNQIWRITAENRSVNRFGDAETVSGTVIQRSERPRAIAASPNRPRNASIAACAAARLGVVVSAKSP